MENNVDHLSWREISVIDYIEGATRTRINWIGNFNIKPDIVENIFYITKTKAREVIIGSCRQWQAFVSDSCFSLHVIPEGNWKNLDGKKEPLTDWINSQCRSQDPTLFKFDGKRFEDNKIITTFDIIKKKRLIVDGLHRAYALQKACNDGIKIPELKILDCYGSKIEVIFPCDIHQL